MKYCKMLKETDPHRNCQRSGDLSPSVVPIVHHTARVKLFFLCFHDQTQKVMPVSAMNLHIPNES